MSVRHVCGWYLWISRNWSYRWSDLEAQPGLLTTEPSIQPIFDKVQWFSVLVEIQSIPL